MSTASAGVGRWSYRNTRERRLTDLPVLPITVARLLRLNQDSTEFFEELAAVVEDEPGLATKLVALANSAAYARGKQVTRIREAAIRVGADAAMELVLTGSFTRVFLPREPWQFALWIHAVRVANFARCLARMCDPEEVCPDTAQLVGLLHELGQFVLFHEAPWALRDLAHSKVAAVDRSRAERALLGIDHQMLGAEAATRWGLPPPVLVALLRYQQTDVDATSRVAALVRVADRCDPTCGGLDDTFQEDALLARLEAELPHWFPHPASRVVPGMVQAVQDAHARLTFLLPNLPRRLQPEGVSMTRTPLSTERVVSGRVAGSWSPVRS